MDLPIRNQSCFFVRTVSIVYIVTGMVMVDKSGYCRLITTKSVCYTHYHLYCTKTLSKTSHYHTVFECCFI